MSKTERREVYTTREVRTLSPHMRTLSNENLSEFNHNLDHLLEDLQSSVSRPGSSLGNTYRETTRTTTSYGGGKTDSLNRVQQLTAANPTTIVSDDSAYSYKPGETVKSVKIIKEDYGTINMRAIDPENTGMQKNINKLDSLLDDLQQVRQGTLNRDAGIDSGFLEPSSNKQVKKTVHRELVYDKESSLRKKRAGSVEREIIVNDESYGNIRRQPSPSRTGTMQSTKSYNYSTENRNIAPNTEIIETTHPDINPNVLAQLDPNLVPPPNTKVTTTIKTYTYEIPGSGYPSAVSPKLSETVYSSNPSTPSQSFHYNKVENNSTSNLTNYPGSYVRPVSPNPSGYSRHVETTTTTRNVTSDGRPKLGFESPSLTRKTYIHDENNTTTTTRSDYPHTRTPRSPKPAEKQVHIYNETTTTNVNNQPPQNVHPIIRYPNESPGSTHRTYIYETNTTKNVSRNGYPPNQNGGYPPNQDGGYPPKHGPDHTTIIYKQDTNTTNNYGGPNQPYTDSRNGPPYGYKPGRPGSPGDNVNITYKYSSQSTTKNNYKGYPNDEAEPLLSPRFPTGPNEQIDGPPKHLDKLLSEIGNEPPNNAYNAGYNAKQAELAHKKEVEKLSESSTQKKVEIKDLPKTKNIAGPPVYYPPGEMFTHKEESGAWRAEGGMMKEKGKYKYEASSKSKEKSSSGMAVVPVCLPLCCGLPCTII